MPIFYLRNVSHLERHALLLSLPELKHGCGARTSYARNKQVTVVSVVSRRIHRDLVRLCDGGKGAANKRAVGMYVYMYVCCRACSKSETVPTSMAKPKQDEVMGYRKLFRASRR